jgi:iron(III) transport system permease protein
MWRWQTAVFAGVAMAAALLAMAPLASLVALAFDDTGDLWPHLARYVIPATLVKTILLLAGVAAVTSVIGAGTAWTITTFAFPGRDALSWLLPLPLAIPTYIVAYVYVDILDAIGPVQSALRTVFGWRSVGDYWLSLCRWRGPQSLLGSHWPCLKRSTTSARANISGCRP